MDTAEPIDRLASLIRQRKAFVEFGCYALKEVDLDKILTEASRLCAEGIGVRYAKVLEHRTETKDLVVRAGFGWKPHVIGKAIARADMRDPSGRTLLTRQPVVIDDINEIGVFSLPSIYPEHGIASAANVVILGEQEDRPWGVLEADSTQTRRFAPDDLVFLQGYANVLSAAVIGSRRMHDLRQAHDTLIDLLREQQHRVRNNLQSIAMHLRLNSDEASTEDSRQRFHTVERRVFALASLYDHLIGSGLGAGVDLDVYLRDLLERARDFLAAETPPIGLALEVEPGVAAQVSQETATAIGTVVNELVANAVEHAFGKAGGTITLRVGRDAERRIRITVEDDGKGVSSAMTPGLGLSVVQRLIAHAGGTLDLESRAGRTIWTIRLERTL